MCGRLSLAYLVDFVPTLPQHSLDWIRFWEAHDPDGHYPLPLATADFPNAPATINAAAKEAHLVFSVEAYRATAILCRATIEAICKDKEAEGGSLVKKIDNLHERGLIRLFVKDTAHVLRAVGNDMAHGDFDAELSPEDAGDILGFMDSIIDELYESQAKLQRMMESVKARKQAAKKQG